MGYQVALITLKLEARSYPYWMAERREMTDGWPIPASLPDGWMGGREGREEQGWMMVYIEVGVQGWWRNGWMDA